ncbi:WD40-repeat-containing domain protein [Collybia nuda]|uniref:WD40-repeat-containing domain protein n=1 Tax=Collybia nuda TaxID=64659 RepID=A0A9P5YC24_9AGAR|nr:WD40-repeat-containing domain protein [Collybia nuda]
MAPIITNNVETIDLTFSPPPVRIDLSEDIDVDLSQDEIIYITPRAPSRPNHSLRITTYPGPPSLIAPKIANWSGSKRPAETIILDEPAPPLKRARDTSLPISFIQPPRVEHNSIVRLASVKREIIELDSDGEQTNPIQKKRFKQEEITFSDGESDYDCIHAGYDLTNCRIWKPTPTNEGKLEQGFIDGIQKLAVSSMPPHRQYVDISNRSVTKKAFTHPTFIWEQICQVPLLRRTYPRNTIHQVFLPPGSHGKRRFRHTTTPQFQCLATFKNAPGSINKIVQSGPWVGICSAAINGHPDGPNEREYPYNREGSVMIWNGSVQIPSGHCRDWGQYTKYYTVNDIKPDPTSTSFVSSGNDKHVRVWTHEPDNDKFIPGQEWRFRHVPHDVAFKPGEAILAIAEQRIYIYSDISADSAELILPLSEKHSNHCVGAMVWGAESTSNVLFASSEPPLEHGPKGYHKAFDVGGQRTLYQFDAHEAGDTMGISPDGTRLALLTCGADQIHYLRIYDVAHGLYSDSMKIQLELFPSSIEGEVNSANFSPDGIYLALGRNDNHTHVYDSRMLNRLLFDYEHCGSSRVSPGSESYGVVQTQWVDTNTRRLPTGLYTAGNDGCVRFWDPLRSAKDPINGQILVESSFDIGCFSIGDYHLGERDIIVGDCAGEVSVFEMRYWGA